MHKLLHKNMFAPEALQSILHYLNALEMLWLRHCIFRYFPAGFDRIELRRIRRDELNRNPVFMFCKQVPYDVCLMESCIVKDEHVFFAWIKPSKKIFQEERKSNAILGNIEIIIKSCRTCECPKYYEFFAAPKECSFWPLSLEKPDSFVSGCKLEACFIDRD